MKNFKGVPVRVSISILLLVWLWVLCCSCNAEKQFTRIMERQARQSQKEMRGEGKHLWKGGPFKQNRQFTGYK